MRTQMHLIVLLLITSGLAAAMVSEDPEEPTFTTECDLNRCHVFLPSGGNKYFKLHPGRFLRFEGEEDGVLIELEITVLPNIYPIVFEENGRWILTITRIIEEREWADGELV